MIALYGGSFNPPTIAHKLIIEKLVQMADKVVVVPMNDHYEKKGLALFEHRFNMLNLLKEDLNSPKLEISNIEKEIDRKLSAFEIFKILSERYSSFCDIRFVMGSDNLKNLHIWENSDELMKYKYIIIKRSLDDVDSILKGNVFEGRRQNFIVIEDLGTAGDISSTLARENALKGQINEKYTIKNIEDYINLNKLYQEKA